MKNYRNTKNTKKWWQMIVLLLLALLVLGIRAWGFKDRVLGFQEAERYLAICTQAGMEKDLWVYRLRELGWIAGSMLFGVTVGWWLAGILGAAGLVCVLGICPNKWWILLLAVVGVVAMAFVRKMPVWDRIPKRIAPALTASICLGFVVVSFAQTMKTVKENEENWAKMQETLTRIDSVDEGLMLYNQPKYEDFFSYYFRDTKLSWHEEVKLSDIEQEYAYMIYEEGMWFADREVKEYGITYTDLGSLWFADLEDSLHLIQVQWGKYSAQVRSKEATKSISEKGADSVLIPMFPMDNFKAEYFELFLGCKMVHLDTLMTTGRQLVGALEYVLANTQSLQTVYIGMNQNEMGQEQNWNELLTVMGKYPQIHFQILFASPRIEMLTQGDGLEKWVKNLSNAVNTLGQIENAQMAYVGDLDWLILNSSNMTKEGRYTDRLAKNIAANALMSKIFPIDVENLQEHIDRQETLVKQVQSGKYSYEKGEGKTILFLGDSIFGYTQGSASIPGVVENIFGAKTYNLGYGGLSATTDLEKGRGALQLWQGATTGDVVSNHLDQNVDLCQQILTLQEDKVLEEADQGQNLVFVLNFGLNDYFSGKPIGSLESEGTDTYLGAMRTVIELIGQTYPQASMLVLTPNFVVEFEYGTKKMGPDEAKLEDFREAIVSLAQDLNVPYVQVNDWLDLKKENQDIYLVDGTHPNFYGNFCYALMIADKLEEILN